jgi:hypothetical protein
LGKRDEDEASRDEIAEPACDESEQRVELDLTCQGVSDLTEGLEVAEPAGRGLVQPRVLDRHRRLRREQLRQLLVLEREGLPAFLLGEIEVPEGDAPEQDRHAEKALHRRVVRREPDRAGIVAEIVQPQRLRVADQDAENPPAAWEIADRRMRLGVDAVVRKRSRPVPVWSITPNAAYRAPVSCTAVSTSCCRSASSESSELRAMPASTSARRRSGAADGSGLYRVAWWTPDSIANRNSPQSGAGSSPMPPPTSRRDPLCMERVADAMHWGLVHCAPDATLREVATLMAERRRPLRRRHRRRWTTAPRSGAWSPTSTSSRRRRSDRSTISKQEERR